LEFTIHSKEFLQLYPKNELQKVQGIKTHRKKLTVKTPPKNSKVLFLSQLLISIWVKRASALEIQKTPFHCIFDSGQNIIIADDLNVKHQA